jgi:hypothetical protein
VSLGRFDGLGELVVPVGNVNRGTCDRFALKLIALLASHLTQIREQWQRLQWISEIAFDVINGVIYRLEC